MNKQDIIDALVQSATTLFGDDRDRASPLAFGLGDKPMAEAVCYANALQVAPLFAASAYRRRLESLSDDEMAHECEAALALHDQIARTRVALEQEVAEADEQEHLTLIRAHLRQLGSKGGAKPKLAAGILEACRAVNCECPGIGLKEAWRHLSRIPYDTPEWHVSGEGDRLMQRGNGKTITIGFEAFRHNYWPRRRG